MRHKRQLIFFAHGREASTRRFENKLRRAVVFKPFFVRTSAAM
jgi:hypothetical protein